MESFKAAAADISTLLSIRVTMFMMDETCCCKLKIIDVRPLTSIFSASTEGRRDGSDAKKIEEVIPPF